MTPMPQRPAASRSRSPPAASARAASFPESVNLVVSEFRQFRCNREVCVRRSGFVEVALRFSGAAKHPEEAPAVRLDHLGIDEHALCAVTEYLRCNSVSIRELPAPDLDALIEFFDLRELREELAETHRKNLEGTTPRTCLHCGLCYTTTNNCVTACSRLTRTADGTCCRRCGLALAFCPCLPVQCPHSDV